MRASDAEREQAVERLRHAAGDGRLTVEELDERIERAYASRTVADLTTLTADVTVTGDTQLSASSHTVPIRPGPGGSSFAIAIMSGSDRHGRWRVAPKLNVISVMGGADIDLNDAELSAQETTISVFSLMGGADIQVPEGVDVQVSKLGLMGGNDVKLSDRPIPPGAPIIHLRLLSIMGGCAVHQGRKLTKAQRRQERELRKARERGELEQ